MSVKTKTKTINCGFQQVAESGPVTKSYWLQSPRARIGKKEWGILWEKHNSRVIKSDITEEEARGPTIKCRERAHLPAYFVVLDSSMDQKQ